ncbi:MAG: diacylglycerol kinase family protein [Isosphaeraceae bacterium]
MQAGSSVHVPSSSANRIVSPRPEADLQEAYGPEGNWVGIVANKGSGRGGSSSLVRKLARELEGQGFDVRMAWTPEERRALVAAADKQSGCRCLVAAGGDGTVSALINEQPRVPITVLPAGTENLGARHFGLKRNPAWLARTIATGELLRTDLGLAAGRRFLLMAGFGFDGDVVTRHHRSRISPTGKIRPTHRAAYVEPILRASLFYRFPPISVAVADQDQSEVLAGTTVFVFNLPRYALGLPFAPQAQQDDGLLDVVVFRDPGPFQALYYLWRVFMGNHFEHPGVTHRRVRRVTVSSQSVIPVQLDGDPAGFLGPPGADLGPHREGPVRQDWTIEVIPGAIQVLVAAAGGAAQAPLPLARQRLSG